MQPQQTLAHLAMRGKAPLLNAMATFVKAVSNISNDRFMAGNTDSRNVQGIPRDDASAAMMIVWRCESDPFFFSSFSSAARSREKLRASFQPPTDEVTGIIPVPFGVSGSVRVASSRTECNTVAA